MKMFTKGEGKAAQKSGFNRLSTLLSTAVNCHRLSAVKILNAAPKHAIRKPLTHNQSSVFKWPES